MSDASDALRVGPIEVRPDEYGLIVEGKRVYLTVREFQVFGALVRQPDAVIPRERLYERVWGATMRHRDRSVDAVVRRVRVKLAAVAPGWVFIHTHFGIGYRFAPQRAEQGDRRGAPYVSGGSAEPER
jgi:DNA-binding response OmpR family regulator